MYKIIINYIIVIQIIILVSGCGQGATNIELISTESNDTQMGESNAAIESNLLSNQNSESTIETENIVQEVAVYICGAVKMPGVYEFPEGTRIDEVIQAAGGMTAHAQQEYLNQAQVIVDGEKIYLPTMDEVAQGDFIIDSSSSSQDNGKINLNTASKEQLMTLTGVGEAKAQSILSYREQNGFFSEIEDIMKISGIKDAVFQTIKEAICV